MKNYLKILSLSAVFIIFSITLFYWYSYKPYKSIKDCSQEAQTRAIEKLNGQGQEWGKFNVEVRENYFKICLNNHGIK